jgi:hypothetical protein
MTNLLSKYLDKLFFKQWIVGICKGDIREIIRNKSFDPDIKWFYLDSFDKFVADPFFVKSRDGNLKIIFEDYPFSDDYGKISLMTIDKGFRQIHEKLLLDTGSHLSYPFVYYENNKIFIFPEAAKSGKLSCYEYDPADESLKFIKDIIDLPLRDATFLKYGNKYWIFAIISDDDDYKMHLFFSDSLLGPYKAHKNNPVKCGLNGTRSAGNFTEVDGVIYRPAQNCNNGYGESIIINKLIELNEDNVSEVPYLTITLNKKNKNNKAIHSLHTINQIDNTLVIDGEQWTFAPWTQLKKFAGDIRMFKKSSKTELRKF